MTIALIQDVWNGSTSSSTVPSFSATLTGTGAGHYLHVGIIINSGETITVADGSNTYSQLGSTLTNGTNRSFYQYAALNRVGGTLTFTVTFTNGSSNQWIIIFREIGGTSGVDTTGMATNSAAGQYQSSPGTAANAVTTGNFTPSVAPGGMSAFTWSQIVVADVSAGTGFTLGANGNSSTSGSLFAEFQRYTSTTPLAGTWTYTVNQAAITAAAVFIEQFPPFGLFVIP